MLPMKSRGMANYQNLLSLSEDRDKGDPIAPHLFTMAVTGTYGEA